jgi:eukaryotic-like serine/threonine-protein kinase
MSGLRDNVIGRLRRVAGWPEFTSERYELIEEIGRGGMGTVYRASDRELDREVAIKVPNGTGDSAPERRLHFEARILARLEHPGIIPIHDSGRLADGRLFYVMKRVRGKTLYDALRDLPDLAERLRIFERVCEPVAFAHDAGVIHRDLKPDNVMIGPFGEVMVMDWGVAKELGTAAGGHPTHGEATRQATQAGTVIGTRGFMPPEQASGDGSGVDARADVYSLGAILYLLLTSADPATETDPRASMLARRDIPKPLRSVCATALDPAPARRYDGVAAFAEDIARYRAGLRPLAHEETLADHVIRLGRTYRTPILLVLGYIVMRIAVALTAGW